MSDPYRTQGALGEYSDPFPPPRMIQGWRVIAGCECFQCRLALRDAWRWIHSATNEDHPETEQIVHAAE